MNNGCIRKKRPMIPGLLEGLQSHKVCEAIIKSSESGMVVNI